MDCFPIRWMSKTQYNIGSEQIHICNNRSIDLEMYVWLRKRWLWWDTNLKPTNQPTSTISWTVWTIHALNVYYSIESWSLGLSVKWFMGTNQSLLAADSQHQLHQQRTRECIELAASKVLYCVVYIILIVILKYKI